MPKRARRRLETTIQTAVTLEYKVHRRPHWPNDRKPGAGDSYEYDFTAMDQYLDLAQKHMGKPKLVIFIDEAHLIFNEASKALLEQIETIIKLIRSKGVGIIFCTQSPTDIPDSVLAQLGLKVQHALRAFTAKDRKDIKLVAENYPMTEFYEVDKLITEMGIGEALVSVLNEKGIPTALVHTMMCAPSSRMDVITEDEKQEILQRSELVSRYNEEVDRKSAYEMLSRKIEEHNREIEENKEEESRDSTRTTTRRGRSTLEKFSSNPLVKTIFRELTRGVLGVLGGKTTTRRR